jgi:hypothetical protein
LSGAAPTPPQLTKASAVLNVIAIKRPSRIFFNMRDPKLVEPLLPEP